MSDDGTTTFDALSVGHREPLAGQVGGEMVEAAAADKSHTEMRVVLAAPHRSSLLSPAHAKLHWLSFRTVPLVNARTDVLQ